MNFRKIESERLDIYALSSDEVKAFFAEQPRAVVMHFFGMGSDDAYDKERYKYETGVTTYRTRVVKFVLRDRAMDITVGECGFHNWYPEHKRTEIGYIICDDIYKRKGYMGEAVARIVRYGFEELELNRIEAFVSPDNMASLGVMRKNGFVKEGQLRQHFSKNGQLDDSVVFGLLLEDFLRRSG